MPFTPPDLLGGAVAALDAAGVLAVCTWRLRDGEAYLDRSNTAFEALLGCGPGDLDSSVTRTPTSWRQLTRGASATPLDEPPGAPLSAGAAAEHVLACRDGRRVVALITTVRGAEHDLLVSLCVNVTEQAKVRHEAERASQAKSRFLGVITHELRTPLNTIGGQVELLREGVYGPSNERQQEALARVHRAERQLKRVIDEVLTFTRLETGNVLYDVRPVALAPTLRAVADAVATQCAAKRQTITLELPDHEIMLIADEEKLQEALRAVVSNASKFTPPQGQIVIDSASRPGAPGFLFIRVTDTGVGVPDDHWESIFSPFTQVDESRSRVAEGLGLGLAIARDLVRGMGGDVRVRSRPGEGATFTLAIPRHVGPDTGSP